ncbi:RDD family protein [Saccharopolyspora sp. NPDC047091]|uniref:RDD family protein n=1 Tax=Saccharopolyspora sp. NPDC047091 TaxID=3155924 RepID=UPI00340E93C4
MVPTVQNPAQDATDPRAKAAFLGRRCTQIALDALLLWLVCMLQMLLALVLAIPLIKFGMSPSPAFVATFAVFFALMIAENWWWHVWFPYRHDGSTIVMRWLRLRVIAIDGERARLAQHNARWLLVSVDAMFFGLVGLVLMIVTPQHQRLGDIVARTHVVRVPAEPAGPARDEAAPSPEAAPSAGPAPSDEAAPSPAAAPPTGPAQSGEVQSGEVRTDGAAAADRTGEAPPAEVRARFS